MNVFGIGYDKNERVEIRVSRYAYPFSGETFDDNWLDAEVVIRVGRLGGRYPASFQTSDFLGLQRDLKQFHQSLEGSVVFETLEGQLQLEFKVDKLGHITVDGMARDQPGIGSTLKFQIGFDQTYLLTPLTELDALVHEFPFRK